MYPERVLSRLDGLIEFSMKRGKYPKFSSWRLIPANFGWCFHAMSARFGPTVQIRRITK